VKRQGSAVDRDNSLIRKNIKRCVHIITGASGAGKSLLLSQRIALQLITCYWINRYYQTWHLPRPLTVWSNLDVGVNYRPSLDGALWPGADKAIKLHPLPLNIYKLYTFDEEMKFGFIDIDELDLIADRQDWQNGGQKLLMAIMRQIRKRHLSLAATIQSTSWLNPRFLFHVDMITKCRDSAVTSWGQENGLQDGAVTFLSSTDNSGTETGYMFEENGVVHESQLFGKHLHGIYDTDFEFNPFEHMESISVKKKKLVLDPNAKNEVDHYEGDLAIIEETLNEYLENGSKNVRVKDFFEVVQSKGLVMGRAEVVSYVASAFNVREYPKMGYPHLDFKEAKNLKVRGKK